MCYRNTRKEYSKQRWSKQKTSSLSMKWRARSSWIMEALHHLSSTFYALTQNEVNLSKLALTFFILFIQIYYYFLTVRSRVRFPSGSVAAHWWRFPSRTKQLSNAPASFRLSTLLIIDEFLIENVTTINIEIHNFDIGCQD